MSVKVYEPMEGEHGGSWIAPRAVVPGGPPTTVRESKLARPMMSCRAGGATVEAVSWQQNHTVPPQQRCACA